MGSINFLLGEVHPDMLNPGAQDKIGNTALMKLVNGRRLKPVKQLLLTPYLLNINAQNSWQV